MEIARLIHDKLVTDFAALKFSNNATIFNNVKKFFASGSMEALDCVILPDSTPEVVEGQSAGNSQTTRIYNFRAFTYEQIEAASDDAAGSMKYSRLLNTQDSILDYLQKEPSNLNAWGNTNNIRIYKIRVNSVNFDTQRSEGGFLVLLEISFGVYLNIIPQS